MEILLGGMAVVFLIGLWLHGIFWPMVIGGIVGSFFGVAGFGGAVSGMLPGAIIGGVIAVAMKKNKKDETK